MSKRHPERTETRRTAAEERRERWEALTAGEKLKELDKRLGKGTGAEKQRARLKAERKAER